MTNPQPQTLNLESDQDNADHLVTTHRNNIRYCTDSRTWFAWADNKWVIDHEANIVGNYWTALARNIPPQIQTQNGTKSNPHYKYSLSHRGQQAALAVAKKDPRIQVQQANFDNNPYELNTPQGIIDLHTGELSRPRRSRLHTKQTLVAPTFNTPHRWLAFLREVFQGDQEVIDYVQRLLGLALIGEVVEQIMPFAHGPGGTGKSTFLNVLLDIVADYGKPAQASLLMRGANAHPEEIAKLQGVRICVMLEFNQDDRFNEAKLKSLTGADKLEGRHMYKSSFGFEPAHTLFLAGNSRPSISEGGSGMWRRMRRIPFVNESFKAIDKGLHKKLVRDEGSDILGWIVQGSKLYLEDNSLIIPTTIAVATAEYEHDEDTLGQFLEEECLVGEENKVSFAEFYDRYSLWCRSYGYSPLGAKKLKEKLTSNKKYGNIRYGKLNRNTRGYIGVGLDTRVPLR